MKKITTLILLTHLLVLGALRGQSYCTAVSADPAGLFLQKISVWEQNIWTGNDGGYGYHDSQIQLIRGECMQLCVDYNLDIPKFCHIWIDMNHNGVFDTSERILDGFMYSGSSGCYVIDLPATAQLGVTRMRIVSTEHPEYPSPCGTFLSGEVEDHTVVIYDEDYYCSNEGSSTYYEWIDHLHFSNIPNPYSGNNNGYLDATCDGSISVHAGYSYTMTCYPGFSGSRYPERWRVYFDWNQDGDFTDPGEMAFDHTESYKFYQTITIPFSASGYVRMRVTMAYPYSTANAPCGTIAYGEVEDYRLYVQDSTTYGAGNQTGLMDMGHDEYLDLAPYTSNNKAANLGLEEMFVTTWDKQVTANFQCREPQYGDLTLYDVSGRQVAKSEVLGREKVDFLVSAPGVYLLIFENDFARITRKCLVRP